MRVTTLVSQRFPRLEHMLDSCLGFFLLQKINKGLPFKAQNDIIGHFGIVSDIPATDHISDSPGQKGVIFADKTAAGHVADLGGHHALGCLTQDLYPAFDRGRIAIVQHFKYFFFGLTDKMVPVENDSVVRSQKSVGPGFGGRPLICS